MKRSFKKWYRLFGLALISQFRLTLIVSLLVMIGFAGYGVYLVIVQPKHEPPAVAFDFVANCSGELPQQVLYQHAMKAFMAQLIRENLSAKRRSDRCQKSQTCHVDWILPALPEQNVVDLFKPLKRDVELYMQGNKVFYPDFGHGIALLTVARFHRLSARDLSPRDNQWMIFQNDKGLPWNIYLSDCCDVLTREEVMTTRRLLRETNPRIQQVFGHLAIDHGLSVDSNARYFSFKRLRPYADHAYQNATPTGMSKAAFNPDVYPTAYRFVPIDACGNFVGEPLTP